MILSASRRRALQWSLAGLAAPVAALAQEGSLRIVVPFAAGSGTDNAARVFGEAVRLATGRTVIVDAEGEFRVEDLIADEDVAITVSATGYIKRTAITEYRSQRRGGRDQRAGVARLEFVKQRRHEARRPRADRESDDDAGADQH